MNTQLTTIGETVNVTISGKQIAGTVISINRNRIRVQFANKTKKWVRITMFA